MKRFVVAFGLSTVVCIGSALADTFHVDGAKLTPGDGSSWSNASNDLFTIWNDAEAGDLILVATGIYLTNSGTNTTASFEFHQANITVEGGYPGYQDANPYIRDIVANPTILSGQLAQTFRTTHLIKAINLFNDAEDNCRVDGFMIEEAVAVDGDGPYGNHGGGALIIASGVDFIRCRFTDNVAGYRGGAVYVEDGPEPHEEDPEPDPENRRVCRFVNCVFQGNGSDEGGAIAAAQGYVVCHNVLFLDNEATTVEETGKGGGLFTSSDSARITKAELENCTFHLNTSDIGASVRNQTSLFTAQNCIFWDGSDSFSDAATLAADKVVFSTSGNTLPSGTGNNTDDPLLDSTGRPSCDSLVAINTGDQTLLPSDTFNIDNDNGTTVLPLDLDESRRVSDGEVDRGAFEVAEPNLCPADINDDGLVNVTDLLAVISAWGTCGSPCPADVAPTCGGDGLVNNTDMLLVISLWGECHGGGESMMSSGGGDAELQAGIADCIAAAEQNGLEGSAYAEFMMECILGLLDD